MKNFISQRGFSVVELMVALLLGLFLVSGVTAMYISSKQSYRVTDNLSRLQESLRFSLEFISRDIRMAGYMPCRFPPNVSNVIDDPITGDATTGSDAWYLDYFNFGIRGFEGHASTPALNVAANTDAIVILKGGLFSASVGFHQAATNTITLQGAYSAGQFNAGDIAIICDPRQASIFQVSGGSSGNATTNGTISYDGTGITPGNTSTNIGFYGDDAQITPYEPVMYFVRPSTQDPSRNSLWRRTFTSGTTQTAQMLTRELLEGVESMQIQYGVDSVAPRDQIVDRYVTANNVANWDDVISVRVGLLMETGEQLATQADTNTYNVAGTLVSDTSTPAHGGDRRLRYVVNTTINLRNRVAN